MSEHPFGNPSAFPPGYQPSAPTPPAQPAWGAPQQPAQPWTPAPAQPEAPAWGAQPAPPTWAPQQSAQPAANAWGAPQSGWGSGYPAPEKKSPVMLIAIITVVVAMVVAGLLVINTRRGPSTPTAPPTMTFTAPTSPTNDEPSYRDPSGEVTATEVIDVRELRVGDCVYNVSEMADDNNMITKLEVVPCSIPHEAEVFAVNDSMPDDVEAAKQFCMDAFAPYVGIAWDDSELWMVRISNSKDNTRWVECLVYDKGQMVTTPFKDSKK